MDAGFLSSGLIAGIPIIGRRQVAHVGNRRLAEIRRRDAKAASFFLQWGSDTADFFFDKFVLAGLSLENLGAEMKNAIGTMQTAVQNDVSQLPRLLKAQRRDMGRLAVSMADAAFDARLAERRHYEVLARPL
jgi:hypothetical protein